MEKPDLPAGQLLERTAAYLQKLSFKTEKIRKDDIRVVVCAFLLQPFDADLAKAFGMYDNLFLSPSRANDQLKSAQLVIPDANRSVYRFEMFRGPDQSKPSLEITEAFVGPSLSVRADKEGPVWAADLRVRFAYPSGKDLLFLAEALNGQWWISAFDRAPSLDLEGPAEEEAEDAPKKQRGRPRIVKPDAPAEAVN